MDKVCRGCEYLKIVNRPEGYELGVAECTKHGLVTNFRDMRKFNTLRCVEGEKAQGRNEKNGGAEMSDLIERQAAIDALDKRFDSIPMEQTAEILQLRKDLRELPSAQPERKKGMWIKLDMHAHIADHKCTACGEECYVPTCMGEPMYIYCPNCGAKMEVNK